MTGMDNLDDVRTAHPFWCSPIDCRTTVHADGIRETVHEREAFEMLLEHGGNVIDSATTSWPSTASPTAVVALVQVEVVFPDGTFDRGDPVDIVLDVQDAVAALTERETARPGAALRRAARQVAGGAR